MHYLSEKISVIRGVIHFEKITLENGLNYLILNMFDC